MKKIRNKYICNNILTVLYCIFVIMFSIWILLDAFVFEERISNSDFNNDETLYLKKIQRSEPVITENSYNDENISIEITEKRMYNSTLHIAEIKLSTIKLFKSAFADNAYGRNILQKTSEIAKSNDAIFAINADFYGYRTQGFVLRNGVLYRDTKQENKRKEDLVIYNNGDFEIINENETDIHDLLKKEVWQIFEFGPGIIKDGKMYDEQYYTEQLECTKHPRTGIGMIDDLHYLVIVVDGRSENEEGVTLAQFAQIFSEYNVKTAYNFDGGGSSTMWFNGRVINKVSDGNTTEERGVSDIAYIGY